MIETKTAYEIPSALDKIAKAFAEVMDENQELQKQVEVLKISNKNHAVILDKKQTELLKLKEAADEKDVYIKELQRQVEELKEKNFLQLGRIQGLKDENKKFRFKSDCDDDEYAKLKEASDDMANDITKALLPENIECDGDHCIGCYKDVLRNTVNKYNHLKISKYEPTKTI